MDFRFAKMVSPLIQEASSFLKKDAITFISPVTSLRLNIIMSSRDRDLFYPLLISAINLSLILIKRPIISTYYLCLYTHTGKCTFTDSYCTYSYWHTAQSQRTNFVQTKKRISRLVWALGLIQVLFYDCIYIYLLTSRSPGDHE